MIRGLVKSILPAPALALVRRWRTRHRRGLPRGLQSSVLEDVVAGMGWAKPRSIHYCKLSAWKDAGTFRLFLRFRNGRERTLIYKRAVYSLEEIPANEGLPVRQGPPEFVIARATDGPLARFVPRACWSRARDVDQSFEYLWEDLSVDHVPFVEYQQSHPRADVCEDLAAMHRALRDQFPAPGVAGLLNFDRLYHERIWEYAVQSLGAYLHATGDPMAKAFLDRQQEVRMVFLDPSFHVDRPTQVIHGDCNSSNMWVRRQGEALQLKAVDWEWAGYGMPHADIVSIVKWRTDEEKEHFLRRYCAAAGVEDTARERRWLRRANMERAILDGAFIAKQHLDPVRSHRWFKEFIRRSLEQLLREATRFAQGTA